MTEEIKKKRGGVRPGAGRKALPKDEVRVITTISVAPRTKQRIDRLRDEFGIAIGREVDDLVLMLSKDLGIEDEDTML